MIVSLRGTHGSGKSHIVRQILARYNAVPESVDSKGKIQNYQMQLSNKSMLYVIGSYVNACGGCDGIQPYSDIWPRIERLAKLGHVLFEGALVSSSYGNIGRAMEAYGEQAVFAFLNTPVAVCLERIKQRRLARGSTKPLDPRNTQHKYDSIQKSIPKIKDVLKRRVAHIDYRNPLPKLLGLFYHA